MYRYGFTRQKQERKAKVFILLCIAGILLFFLDKSNFQVILGREITSFIYQEMVGYCLPIFEYKEKEMTKTGIGERILSYMIPIMEEKKEMEHYQTQIESEFSYEMILAMEAAAENYVNVETGEVVGDFAMEELQPELPQESQQVEASANTSLTGKTQKVVSYSREKLKDFDYLIQNFYRVDKTTTINGEQLNAAEMLEKDMKISHDASTPQILIYHTHSQEGYVDSIAGDASTTIVGVGDYLTQILEEQYGLNVIHHRGEYDVESRDHAYSKAAPALEQILAENPSIEVIIDLHRDGVGEDTRLVTTIDGVEMAKIMFVNGLSRTTSAGVIDYLYNPYLADNLAFSFHTQLALAEYYPGLSRGIYLKGYRFNLHYCPKTLLVEVGAQTNTLQEAMNAMVPLADALNKVVTGENLD